MPRKFSLSPWKAAQKGDDWVIVGADGDVIAKLVGKANNKKSANIFASSPYMLDALKAMIRLIGDEDLEDNGEWSGPAICDQVRSAVDLAAGKINL
jgi:hypothetical protein